MDDHNLIIATDGTVHHTKISWPHGGLGGVTRLEFKAHADTIPVTLALVTIPMWSGNAAPIELDDAIAKYPLVLTSGGNRTTTRVYWRGRSLDVLRAITIFADLHLKIVSIDMSIHKSGDWSELHDIAKGLRDIPWLHVALSDEIPIEVSSHRHIDYIAGRPLDEVVYCAPDRREYHAVVLHSYTYDGAPSDDGADYLCNLVYQVAPELGANEQVYAIPHISKASTKGYWIPLASAQ